MLDDKPDAPVLGRAALARRVHRVSLFLERRHPTVQGSHHAIAAKVGGSGHRSARARIAHGLCFVIESYCMFG